MASVITGVPLLLSTPGGDLPVARAVVERCQFALCATDLVISITSRFFLPLPSPSSSSPRTLVELQQLTSTYPSWLLPMS